MPAAGPGRVPGDRRRPRGGVFRFGCAVRKQKAARASASGAVESRGVVSDGWALDLGWWISVVELPVMAGLFWLVMRARAEAAEETARVRAEAERSGRHLRDALAAFKLEVAKTYASVSYLKDVDARLSRKLETIEEKLDALLVGRARDR